MSTVVRGCGLSCDETIRSCFKFADIDGDGNCEVIGFDDDFIGWHECNASSPMPIIVLRPSKTRFKLAIDLMRSEPPNQLEQTKILKEWNSQISTKTKELMEDAGHCRCLKKMMIAIPTKVWDDMLNLIYSGNSKVAWRLLDKAWVKGKVAYGFKFDERKNKYIPISNTEFKQLFLEKLSHSKYFAGLQKLNSEDAKIAAFKKHRTTGD